MIAARDLHREVLPSYRPAWVSRGSASLWHYAPTGVPEFGRHEAEFEVACGLKFMEFALHDADEPPLTGTCLVCTTYRSDLLDVEAGRRGATPATDAAPDKPVITLLMESGDLRVVHQGAYVDIDGEEMVGALYVERRRIDAMGAVSWIEIGWATERTSGELGKKITDRQFYRIVTGVAAAAEERALHARVVAAAPFPATLNLADLARRQGLDGLAAGGATDQAAPLETWVAHLIAAARDYHKTMTTVPPPTGRLPGSGEMAPFDKARADLCAAAMLYGAALAMEQWPTTRLCNFVVDVVDGAPCGAPAAMWIGDDVARCARHA